MVYCWVSDFDMGYDWLDVEWTGIWPWVWLVWYRLRLDLKLNAGALVFDFILDVICLVLDLVSALLLDFGVAYGWFGAEW